MSPAGRRQRVWPFDVESGAKVSSMHGPAARSKITRLRVCVVILISGRNAAHDVDWLFTAAQPSGVRVGESLRSKRCARAYGVLGRCLATMRRSRPESASESAAAASHAGPPVLAGPTRKSVFG